MPDDADERDWSDVLAHASDVLGEGVILLAPDGATMRAANAAAPRFFGLSADALSGRTDRSEEWAIVDAFGAPLPLERQPAQVAIATGEPQRDVLVGVVSPDRQEWWFSVTAVPLRHEDGALRAILLRFADVTSQQASLRALEIGAQRMAEVERIAQLGTWEYDPGSRAITWSDHLYEMLGVPRRELTYDWAVDYITDDDRVVFDAALHQLLVERRELDGLWRLRRPDGERRLLRIRGRPQFDAEGRVVRALGTAQDVTEPTQMERELTRARDRLRGVLDAVTEHAIIATDARGVVVDVNRGAELVLGYAADELIGGTPERWHDADEIQARAQELGVPADPGVFIHEARQGRPTTREWTFIHRNGDRRRMALTITAQRDDRGEVVGYIAVARDITEVHRAEMARRRAEARFRTAFDHAPIGVALLDLDAEARGCLLEANRALALLVGREEGELVGARLDTLVHPEDMHSLHAEIDALAAGDVASLQCEARLMHRDGQFVWALLGAAADQDAPQGEATAVLQVLDITERKRFEGQLQYLADHDPLTGLFNRRRFEEELERTLAHAARYGAPGALMALDLDGLKAVNDTLGHAAGDELIEQIARLLRDSLRTTDVLARLGGDEFGILLPQLSRDGAEQVATKLLESLRDDGVVVAGNGHGRVTASIGIASWDGGDVPPPHELLIDADLAMYAAKAGGRDRYAVHDDEVRAEHAPLGAAWLDRLRGALDADDGFVLHAQPILPLDPSAGDGIPTYELLIRMRGEDGSLIPPGTFLGLAERYDLVQRLDRWVLTRAIDVIRARERTGRPLNVTVNLSGRTVNDANLARDLERTLADGPIREGALTVEVTETEAIVNIDRARTLARDLRALGCRFALDDFGAGFASFYYLKHLAFDLLKIDGEFIRQLPITPTDRLVVRAVVDIARAMGTHTCAEFVGDDETAEILRELGVDYGQGFHLGRPRPIEDLLREPGAAS